MEVSEDKVVNRYSLSMLYLFFDDSFNRYLRNHDHISFREVSNYAYVLATLGLLPDGVCYEDIIACVDFNNMIINDY